MNSEISSLKKVSFVFALAGLLGGMLFVTHYACQVGYEFKHLDYSLDAFRPIPERLHFPLSYLSPYTLVALAALLSCSRPAAWTTMICVLLILYYGGETYQSLLRSGIPSVNDITNVNLPIQGYYAWIALLTAGWSLVSRLKEFLSWHKRAQHSPAQPPP